MNQLNIDPAHIFLSAVQKDLFNAAFKWKAYLVNADCRYKCVVLTWLEGDFTEHHPDVREVVLALNSTGHVIVEWHGDKAGTGVDIVHHRTERYRCGFPVRLGAEITHHLLKGLHPPWEHVVAVYLFEITQNGKLVNIVFINYRLPLLKHTRLYIISFIHWKYSHRKN